MHLHHDVSLRRGCMRTWDLDRCEVDPLTFTRVAPLQRWSFKDGVCQEICIEPGCHPPPTAGSNVFYSRDACMQTCGRGLW